MARFPAVTGYCGFALGTIRRLERKDGGGVSYLNILLSVYAHTLFLHQPRRKLNLYHYNGKAYLLMAGLCGKQWEKCTLSEGEISSLVSTLFHSVIFVQC